MFWQLKLVWVWPRAMLLTCVRYTEWYSSGFNPLCLSLNKMLSALSVHFYSESSCLMIEVLKHKLLGADSITFISALLFLTLCSFSQMQELNLSYDCQWRYHNYSILGYDPHPSGEFLSFHLALTSRSPCQSGR